MKKNKLIFLSLVATMGFGLFGCNPTSEPTTSSPSTSEPTTVVQPGDEYVTPPSYD